MAFALLAVTGIIIACLLFSKVMSKLGVPMLLAFLILGLICGEDGIFKISMHSQNAFKFMEWIATIALTFIIFFGGFGTNWKTAKPVVGRAVLLSTLGGVLTALIVAGCTYIFNPNFLMCLLLGAVVSSTDAAAVFYILRSKRLNLKYNTAPLLEFESGSNDPAAYMMTVVILAVLGGDVSTPEVIYKIFAQIVYGVLAGFIIGYLATIVLKNYTFTSSSFQGIFVIAVALIAYALPAAIDGNGFLSTYIAGILLGNAKIGDKKVLVSFLDGLTSLMQMGLFFLLGLLASPSKFLSLAPQAIVLTFILTFIARPIAVSMLLAPLKTKFNQQALISFAGLRGASSIAFAIIIVVSLGDKDPRVAYDIFNIVFLMVIFSILVQGTFLAPFAKKINMIDDSEDVMKTFTDYSDEVPIKFIRSSISSGHAWCDKPIRSIILPPETIIVLIERGNEHVVPHGNTVLRENDVLILCARAGDDVSDINIAEKVIDANDPYVGKKIFELKTEENSIIVMIRRNKNIIIPRGNTEIMKGDVLVIHYT